MLPGSAMVAIIRISRLWPVAARRVAVASSTAMACDLPAERTRSLVVDGRVPAVRQLVATVWN